MLKRKTYNERLFSGFGIRSYLHSARFKWFQRTVDRLYDGPARILELGCFDGRLISFCPRPPTIYRGFDADWEGGLSEAQKRFAGHPHWTFHKASAPDHMDGIDADTFNLAASMETLEHIPPDHIEDYLWQIEKVTNGYFLVTVPNEKGPVFLIKYLAKLLFMRSAEQYSVQEVISATFGRLEHVERNEHKGFDHAVLTNQIGRHFDIQSVEALPVRWLPLWASFTVAIVAHSKATSTI